MHEWKDRVEAIKLILLAGVQPVTFPSGPWRKLGIDAVGPFANALLSCRFAITLIDYCSKWPLVCFTPTVTAGKVMYFLRSVFRCEGYPDELVSDRGPQFTASEYETFLPEGN